MATAVLEQGTVVTTDTRSALDKYRAVLHETTASFQERDDVISGIGGAIASGTNMVLLGPPGTGKTMLLRFVAQRMGLSLFIKLATKGMRPEELFGPVSLRELKENDRYVHNTAGMVPEAQLVLLDEIFKAGSAIQNSLLTVMNEHEFDNGGVRSSIPLISFFGASNELPEGNETVALWDRFHKRCQVNYVGSSSLAKILSGRGKPSSFTCLSESEVFEVQRAVGQVSIGQNIIALLVELRSGLHKAGIQVSDRRMHDSLPLLQAEALIKGANTVDESHLLALKDVLWIFPEQRAEVGRMLAHCVSPLIGKAQEILDTAKSAYDEAIKKQASTVEMERMQSSIEAAGKLKTLAADLAKLLETAQAQGRNTSDLDKIAAEIKTMRTEVTSKIMQ